jgi:hypothetical protein
MLYHVTRIPDGLFSILLGIRGTKAPSRPREGPKVAKRGGDK